jgi:hypothetical protein
MPIPLLHPSPSTKLKRECKNHYALLLLRYRQLELHLDLFLQVSLLQNLENTELLLPSVVRSEQ